MNPIHRLIKILSNNFKQKICQYFLNIFKGNMNTLRKCIVSAVLTLGCSAILINLASTTYNIYYIYQLSYNTTSTIEPENGIESKDNCKLIYTPVQTSWPTTTDPFYFKVFLLNGNHYMIAENQWASCLHQSESTKK